MMYVYIHVYVSMYMVYARICMLFVDYIHLQRIFILLSPGGVSATDQLYWRSVGYC